MPSKYHAKRVELDGYTFDSKAEARRYEQLQLLGRAGAIQDLVVHPRFVIVPASDAGRAVVYVADFSYKEVQSSGTRSPTTCWYREVVEDVKGFRTPLYRLKVRLFQETNARWTFREIDANDV